MHYYIDAIKLYFCSLEIKFDVKEPQVNLPRKHFGPQVYPKGSLVIALVRVCVCPCVCPSVFEYLKDGPLVFSNFLHEVGAP